MLTLIICDECEKGNHGKCLSDYLNKVDPNRFFDTRCCVCEVCNEIEKRKSVPLYST